MWEIYDELIDSVPAQSRIRRVVAGLHWIAVESEGLGLAMTPREGCAAVPLAGSIAGLPTREVAGWIKSWNNYEAAIGLAAINSALNSEDGFERSGWPAACKAHIDVFDLMEEQMRGSRVAVIGHFRNLDRLAAMSRLTVLERRQQSGDLPDPACEYVLGQQDIVVITATTLINKTLPRLLELSRNARIVLAGPSTPLTPLLFAYGAEVLGGLVIHDIDPVWNVVQEGGQHGVFGGAARMTTLCAATREVA